jgi:DNA-binding CsgD family transcriptional regulator
MYDQALKNSCTELTPQKVCKGNKHADFVASLTSATKFLDPIAPSLTTRFYCVTNNIGELPSCVCGEPVMANKKDNKLGFTQFCSPTCSRSNKTVDSGILAKLSDKDWLYAQRIAQKKSKETIAEELGCSIGPVNRWLAIHDIPDRQYNKSNIDVLVYLEDYDWLYAAYIKDGRTLDNIATEIGSNKGVVSRYLKQHNITARSGSDNQLSTTTADALTNKEWLEDQYLIKMRSLEDIGADLNCSPRTVRSYLRQHDIVIRNLTEARFGENVAALNLLRDSAWLEEQYTTLGKSTYELAAELGCSDGTVGRYLKSHNIDISTRYSVSSHERKLREFLEEHSIEFECSVTSIITPYELDIYIPSLNMAIEVNGVYWHSEVYKDNAYHEMKRLKCADVGIRLIHLYEDDIIYKFDVIKRFLLNAMGLTGDDRIFARKCTINRRPDKEVCKDILDAHHIQGNAGSTSRMTLEYSGETVAVMLFHGNVLTRYATTKKVIGGFGKLLKASRLSEVISFVDLDMFTGDAYIKVGFVIDAYLRPDYKYVVNDKRYHKFNYRKSRFATDPQLKFDENKTEHELALVNNIYRIYDSGKYRLRWVSE